jgi:Flp pilus assembly protein TadB
VFNQYKELNKMRTILRFVFFAILAVNTGSVLAENKESKAIKEVTDMSNAQAGQMKARLNAIRSMDMSKLNSEQKRDLRKEVTNMKQELQKNRPGYFIYISLTALIIIILLILLL